MIKLIIEFTPDELCELKIAMDERRKKLKSSTRRRTNADRLMANKNLSNLISLNHKINKAPIVDK